MHGTDLGRVEKIRVAVLYGLGDLPRRGASSCDKPLMLSKPFIDRDRCGEGSGLISGQWQVARQRFNKSRHLSRE